MGRIERGLQRFGVTCWIVSMILILMWIVVPGLYKAITQGVQGFMP